MFRHSKIAVIAIALASAGTIAYAEPTPANTALAITQARVSLAQAISIAESAALGKAVNAEFDQSSLGMWTYKVEVVSNTATATTTFHVKVDSATGVVISSIQELPRTACGGDTGKQGD